jgi:death-on-curing family protein
MTSVVGRGPVPEAYSRAGAIPATTTCLVDGVLVTDVVEQFKLTAALMHSLVLNHTFVDGNTRVGAHAAILFVELNGQAFLATPGELVTMTLAVAEGKIAVEALTIWFRQRLRATE